MPFGSQSFDVIVSDIPFGRKQDYGGEAGLALLYQAVLREMKRVLRRDGGTAVLLTSRTDVMDNLLAIGRASTDTKQTFLTEEKRPVKLGALGACMYKLKKANNPKWKKKEAIREKNKQSRKRKALDAFCTPKEDVQRKGKKKKKHKKNGEADKDDMKKKKKKRKKEKDDKKEKKKKTKLEDKKEKEKRQRQNIILQQLYFKDK